ncbi:hypothetical protein TWF569_005656 [Orbilia oligospora]|uniref:Uncharacterized protein n=1 Tax=Orbilia oligospora TaxID=2813651 RepID=A0A7C8N134_ORBOL|nr:hypothetical protein TWF102_002878 [Orbilia oligospora]KAF3098415.1 hypothetical protein TWF706_006846 [Orbilia oligospora]KAF3118134.1 hypothetical protein TWF103_000163 [Orbilia oligospora]KAF3132669.1 hypothetical protein TWF594_009487 [Orbilia oligospora]KAF3156681.1 hypothetical protein TWF569_005656 [Orbilia oligospora]
MGSLLQLSREARNGQLINEFGVGGAQWNELHIPEILRSFQQGTDKTESQIRKTFRCCLLILPYILKSSHIVSRVALERWNHGVLGHGRLAYSAWFNV